MISTLVVILYKLMAGLFYLMAIAEFLKIELFVFDGSKESLYVDIVNGATFPIHGYFNGFVGLYKLNVLLCGELTSLVCLYDLG